MRAFPPICLVISALALCSLTSILAAHAQGNLLLNPGFESGTQGWQCYGGSFACTEDVVRSGDRAGAVTVTGAGIESCIYQTLQVSPGATYGSCGWVSSDVPLEAVVFLRLSWYESEDGYGSQIRDDDSGVIQLTGGGYRFLSIEGAVAPGDANSVRVRIVVISYAATPVTVYCDDLSFVSLAGTPAPGSTPTPAPIATPDPTANLTPTPVSSPTIAPTPADSATPAVTPSPTIAPPPTWSRDIVINEVVYDPERGGQDHAFEWVEIHNPAPHGLDLMGWKLQDNQDMDTLPSVHLPPGGYVVVAAGADFFAQFPDYSGALVFVEDGAIGNGLSNSGDRLVLVDSVGNIIDAMSYGDDATVLLPPCPDVLEGHSLERRPAGLDTGRASDFVDNREPSPGIGLGPPSPTPMPTATAAATNVFDPEPTATSTPQPPTRQLEEGASPGMVHATTPGLMTPVPTMGPIAGPPTPGESGGSWVYLGLYSFLSIVGVGALVAFVWFRVRRP